MSFDANQQLKRYAEDLVRAHQEEKQRSRELEAANQKLHVYAEELSTNLEKLKLAKEALQDSYLETIQKLVMAVEFKDEETGGHIQRMSHYSVLIALKLHMPPEMIFRLLHAAPMHDIGKIGIPDMILTKPARLTPEEFAIIKTHTTIGARILADSRSDIIRLAGEVALTHHEKWDGSGYPRGLKGNDIPIMGRIVALADAFDAITSARPYKAAFSVEHACAIIEKDKGAHFDPQVADVFLEHMDIVRQIKDASEQDRELNFILSIRQNRDSHHDAE